MSKSFEEIEDAYKADMAAGRKFLGLCLNLARTNAGAEGGVEDAITAWHNTQDREPGTDFEHAPDGIYLYYSGGGSGHGHVCWVRGSKNGQPLVYTNLDVDNAKGKGAVRHIQLKNMERAYSNLKRAGMAWDVNGVEATDADQPAPKPKPAQKTYTVRKGDNLGAIAAKFNTTVDALVTLNKIKNADLISVGQKLKLK